jgi:hypothetical protein
MLVSKQPIGFDDLAVAFRLAVVRMFVVGATSVPRREQASKFVQVSVAPSGIGDVIGDAICGLEQLTVDAREPMRSDDVRTL